MKSLLLLLPLAAFLTGCQTSSSTAVPEGFLLADVNKDGKLTLAEACNVVNPRDFNARDRDKNGSITANECIAEEMAEFKATDTNADDKVTLAEFSAYKAPARAAAFRNADFGGDGLIDRAEANAYFSARE